MNHIVYKTLNQVSDLITNTYILAVVAAVVFVLIAMLISKAIAYEGGKNPQDPQKRRIAFWVTGVAAAVVFFVYNFFVVKGQIAPIPQLLSDFNQCVAISTGLTLIIYVALGFVLSRFVCSRGKFGTIFPAK